jgi:hypothetical protein
MRPDQLKRLQDLAEKLADVVLEEADPDLWPGAGQSLADVDQQTRGDRYWCKKNAAATFMLLGKTEEIMARRADGSSEKEGDNGEDLERTIAKAEREASKALERIQAGAGKAAFDRRTHGGKA